MKNINKNIFKKIVWKRFLFTNQNYPVLSPNKRLGNDPTVTKIAQFWHGKHNWKMSQKVAKITQFCHQKIKLENVPTVAKITELWWIKLSTLKRCWMAIYCLAAVLSICQTINENVICIMLFGYLLNKLAGICIKWKYRMCPEFVETYNANMLLFNSQGGEPKLFPCFGASESS